MMAEGELLGRASEGAERVLRECLPLRHGDAVAMFYDEQTEDCAQILEAAAQNLGLRFNMRHVAASEQARLEKLGKLDIHDGMIIEESRAVLISLSSKEGMPYRRRIVRRAVDDTRYVGLMPGATLELLAYAVNIDYEKVERRCDDLAVAMLAGKSAVLTTYQSNGERLSEIPRELKLDLGGFARSPITSTGIVPLGTWGNLPGGETFIAPIEEKAEGSFVLNGAYTGRVLPPESSLVLHFAAGEWVGVDGREEECRAFRAMLHEAAGGPIPDVLGLAELGIGVNEGLEGLTGKALFDEKKEGTAHVAVGDNSIYGGILQSRIHEDFIAQAPSLTIDGKQILDHGQYVLQPSDWREDRLAAQRLGRELPREFAIQRTGLHGNEDRSGLLRVTRLVGDQRKCVYTVGDHGISPDLARLYGLLPRAYEPIRYSLLYDKWQRIRGNESDDYIRGLVAVLCRHHLTQIEE